MNTQLASLPGLLRSTSGAGHSYCLTHIPGVRRWRARTTHSPFVEAALEARPVSTRSMRIDTHCDYASRDRAQTDAATRDGGDASGAGLAVGRNRGFERAVGPWAMELSAAMLRGRWRCSVVRLIQCGRCRFTEILDSLPGLSPKVLTHQLRDLEAAGLVTRCARGSRAAQVSYELTDLGTRLGGVIESLEAWGDLYARHHPDSLAQHGVGGLVVVCRRAVADSTGGDSTGTPTERSVVKCG